MGRYRKVETRIWNDEKFRGLSDDAKLIFLLTLTHPNLTPLGAMRGSVPGLAADLGWTPERFAEGFGELLANGLLEYDDRAFLVALPNFLRYNGPDNPNVLKSWGSHLDLLPECGAKVTLTQRVVSFVETLSTPFREALPIPFRNGMPNGMPKQEQEQEQKQEQGQEPEPEQEPTAERSGADHVCAISKKAQVETQHWVDARELASRMLAPTLPTAMPDDRSTVLRLAYLRIVGRLSEHDIVDGLEAVRRRDGGRPRKPVAYFVQTLREKHPDLNRLLAPISVPKWILGEPIRPPRPEAVA